MPAVHSLRQIPSGDAGIRATLKEMAAIVRAWKKHPDMRDLATSLVAGCGVRNWYCDIESLHGFVRDEIRFVPDIADVETLQTPELTLSIGAGDCDDQSILLATLLQAIGHPARFLAVDLGHGGFSHVFTETPIGPHWRALETTEDWEIGRRPHGVIRNMVQRV